MSATASAGTRTGPIALVAEDEPTLARTLCRLLKDAWPALTLDNSVVSRNVTAGDGGGVYVNSSTVLTFLHFISRK